MWVETFNFKTIIKTVSVVIAGEAGKENANTRK